MAETLLTNLLLIYIVASFAARDLPQLASKIGRKHRAKLRGPKKRRKVTARKLSTGDARRLASQKVRDDNE